MSVPDDALVKVGRWTQSTCTGQLAELKSRSAGIAVVVQGTQKPTYVRANPNLLAQALNHIFQNCLDALEAKSENDPRFRGRIEVEIKNLGTQSEIHIKDNGIGINEEQKSEIFKPRFTTKSSGSGLGLAIAANMIDSMGGTIRFDSTPGEGTIFFVELPLIREVYPKSMSRIALDA